MSSVLALHSSKLLYRLCRVDFLSLCLQLLPHALKEFAPIQDQLLLSNKQGNNSCYISSTRHKRGWLLADRRYG